MNCEIKSVSIEEHVAIVQQRASGNPRMTWEVKANFKMEEDDILYPAAALEALQAENEELRLMLSGSTLQIQAMQAQINAMKIAQKVLDGAVQAKSISDSEWCEKYMREVEGLNNEGDPIGGDPPSGLRHAVEYFKSENAAQAKRIADLENKLHERTITSGAKIHELNSEIEALRKQVEALGQTAPTSSGFCSRSGGCVCGGDLPRVRESCSSWVKSAQKGTG
jgi:chromosome segregation ATPase